MTPHILQASVVGSGPNGLSAAIVLAQAGLAVEVYEAQPTPGGAARTLPLTLPGFLHDFGSAVHPLAAGSPFFQTLPLAEHGLRWLHHPTPLAHPFDDGTAVTLERDLTHAASELGPDGPAWRRLIEPFADNWPAFSAEILAPPIHLPSSPLLLARFGLFALAPAHALATTLFRTPRTRALFAGLAAHSFLSLSSPLSAAVGIVLGAATHSVGWPIPQGGAQSITDALISVLRSHGGLIHTNSRVHSLEPGSLKPGPLDLDPLQLASLHPNQSAHQVDRAQFATAIHPFSTDTVTLCDITPAQLLTLAPNRLPPAYRRALQRFQPGPSAFKLDYALSEPIPWRAAACRRASTVHLGGTLEEIALSESEMTRGRATERPFVLVAQPTLADPTRAPIGKHIAWAYCHLPQGLAVHLPHGSDVDPHSSAAHPHAAAAHLPNASAIDLPEAAARIAARIEAQIERFAPGFRDCILSRTISTPSTLEAQNANLQGGDITGGAMTLAQTLLRPTRRTYATPDKRLFLCSASTPPGAGVHGMCGFHAAQAALRSLRG